jgi:hypothetical protein
MSSDQLAAILAERVMGWSVAPDRFMIGNRRWMPAWRFQPLRNLDDAFKLLDATGGTFRLSFTADRCFAAKVRVGRRTGGARGRSPAAVLTVAVASAVGIELEEETAEALLK